MQFCEDHWARLRQAIDDRGLAHLVAGSGEQAARRMERELADGEVSRESFDPLMAAHWAVAGNAMRFIGEAGGEPLYLMGSGPEDPVDPARYGAAHAGRTWPRCPVCYINLAHELTCTDPRCVLDRVGGYDWMLARAADDQLAKARELRLVGPPS